MEGRRGRTNERHAMLCWCKNIANWVVEFSSSQKIKFNEDVVQRFSLSTITHRTPTSIHRILTSIYTPHTDKQEALILWVMWERERGVRGGAMNTHLIDTKNLAFAPVVVYSLYCSRVYRFEALPIRSPPRMNDLVSDCLSFRRVGPVVVGWDVVGSPAIQPTIRILIRTW